MDGNGRLTPRPTWANRFGDFCIRMTTGAFAVPLDWRHAARGRRHALRVAHCPAQDRDARPGLYVDWCAEPFARLTGPATGSAQQLNDTEQDWIPTGGVVTPGTVAVRSGAADREAVRVTFRRSGCGQVYRMLEVLAAQRMTGGERRAGDRKR